jgi:hypothetical protein
MNHTRTAQATLHVSQPVSVLVCFGFFLAQTGVARRGLRGQANVLVDQAAEAWVPDDWSLRRA